MVGISETRGYALEAPVSEWYTSAIVRFIKHTADSQLPTEYTISIVSFVSVLPLSSFLYNATEGSGCLNVVKSEMLLLSFSPQGDMWLQQIFFCIKFV